MASCISHRRKWSSQKPQQVGFASLVTASTPKRQLGGIRQRLQTPTKADALSWSPQRLNHITYVSFGLTPRKVGARKGRKSSARSRTQQKATCLFPAPQEVIGEDSRDSEEGAESSLCVELPSSPARVLPSSPSAETPASYVEGQRERGRHGSQDLVEMPLSRGHPTRQTEADAAQPWRQETSADAKESLRRRPPSSSGKTEVLKSSSSKSHPPRPESLLLDPQALPLSLVHLPYPVGRFSSGGKKSRPCRRHALKRLGARTTTMTCRTCQVALCLDCFAAYHLETFSDTPQP